MRPRSILAVAILLLASGSLFAQGLQISPAALPDGTVGTSYSQTLTAIGGNGPYSWSVVTGSLPPGLVLSSTGVLAGTPTIAGTNFGFTIQATDSGTFTAALSGQRSYTLRIVSPPLTIVTTSLPQGAVGTTYSQTLVATGGSGAYIWILFGGSLPPGITLSTSGILAGVPATSGSYSFSVQVASTIVGLGTVTATQSYVLNIPPPPLTIVTTQLPGGAVGVSYSQALTATGGSGSYTWAVTGGLPPPGIALSPSGILAGVPTIAGRYTFTVQVSSTLLDGSIGTASQSYLLIVSAPALAITTTQLSGGTVGSAYSQVVTATGGTPPYTWRISAGALPDGLTLSASGTIGGTPTTAGTFRFTVAVNDSANASDAKDLTLVIAPPSLTIVTQSLPGGSVGTAYSTTLAATGGTPSYTWRISAGALPDGLTLSASGTIGGTPTAAGTFRFTVAVNDSANGSDAKGLTLTIAPPPLTIVTKSIPDGSVATAYSATLAATGGVTPYTWSVVSGALPAGLGLSAAGVISGTPAAAGTFSVTVQAADASQSKATATFQATILASLRITTASLPGGTTGIAYSQQLAASGGTPPYTWSIESGSLPGGLGLNTANGLISGTPGSAGTFSFTISVTDGSGGQDRAPFVIVTIAPLSITTASPLADGALGVAYSQDLSATGGTAPYQWTIVESSLPPGLSLDAASGRISGTPTTGGSFSFSVQVSDSRERTAAQNFTMNIAAALTVVTPSPLARGAVGRAYRQQLDAGGGKPPYRWSVSAGALPGGIALDAASGLLSGTPAASGNFNFTVSVTDGQQTAAKPYTISVDLPPAPPTTITGLPGTVPPATQPTVSVSIGSAYPVEITGQVTLTFAADSGPDDPAVQFTTGGRTASFRIPAGSLQAVFSSPSIGLQTGTVAGTITLTASMQAAGTDITPTPAPSQVTRIAKAVPVIVSAYLTRTAAGLDLVVIGYSTSRDVTSAAVRYNAVPGVTLAAAEATITLSSTFSAWYQGAAAAPFGSQFSLRIPFTIQGTANPVTSLTVTLTNSVGTSAAANAVF